MSNTTIERLEADISQLSLSDQLLLIERLAQHIRQRGLPDQAAFENQLAVMANDPDIQRELREIEREFARTELDGLDVER